MDLSFKNQTAVLYDKVNYKSSLSMLSADKILVLKGGSLIEEGTHSELRLKKGLYFQLSELQEKGLANF